MAAEGWVVVYTDGSAKRVQGSMQAGYGVWYGQHHHRNFAATCRRMNAKASAGESCRGVLHAMLGRACRVSEW